MKRIAVGDLGARTFGGGTERWDLSGPLETTDVAVNRYRIPPGEGLPAGLHAHADQEELFVVLDGEATFETLVPEEGEDPDTASERARMAARGTPGEVTVGAGEAVRFAPGEFQSGRNEGDEDLVTLAIGAPPESEDVRIPVSCPECGRPDRRMDTGGDGLAFVCPDCGAREVPRDCPECGHRDLQVALGDGGGTVVVCRGCDATFDRPPVRDR